MPSPTYALPADQIEASYAAARARYAALGVDADAAVRRALEQPVSMHCWQADDVAGLENAGGDMAGAGILATGSYPGKPRTGDELRADLAEALRLIPGTLRLNLHALYREQGGTKTDRDAITVEQFSAWIAWARERNVKLDFNPSFFSHPKASSGLTLTHPDKAVREFWIAHGIASRRVAAQIAQAQGGPVVNNLWIPDGAKDSPADRWAPRKRLVESLDAIYDAKLGVPADCVDAVEGKLFGIGAEDFTAGSNEFYAGYALTRKKLLCLDMGHFHPTETIDDKISALLAFHPKLLLHVSRPIRWDSDHVVVLNDDLRRVFSEIARGDAWDRVYVALDFFDASINRTAAHVIGTRATRQAVLAALLEPNAELRALELAGKGAQKLALLEYAKLLPFGAVWDKLCLAAGVPAGNAWVSELEAYEAKALAARQ